MRISEDRDQKKILAHWKLEFQALVNCQMWELGTELRSSKSSTCSYPLSHPSSTYM